MAKSSQTRWLWVIGKNWNRANDKMHDEEGWVTQIALDWVNREHGK